MNTKKTYDIITGPSKDALFDACKYAYNKYVRYHIGLTIAIGYTLPKDNPGSAYITMTITDIILAGIEHEDGSGENLNLHGYCKADLNSFEATSTKNYKSYRFKAYYNCKNRKGWITFE